MILTAGIHGVFRGLKFEPDAEIGQRGAFCKGLKVSAMRKLQSACKPLRVSRVFLPQCVLLV